MAIKASVVDTNLVIHFKTGVDSKGNDVIKSQKFDKTKVDAANEDIHAVGKALGELLTFPITDIERHDEYMLTEEA